MLFRSIPILWMLSIFTLGSSVSFDQTWADDEQQIDPAKVKFFENKIRPVLVEHCYSCHSVDAGESEGGYVLDSRDGIRKGGESGTAVVPGDLDKSLILKALEYDDSFYQMPPDGRLPKQVVEDFRTWIRDGAVDPRQVATQSSPTKKSAEEILADGRKFWSLIPFVKQTPPAVKDPNWCRSPLDRFIKSGLEEAGLKPAPEATKTEWLRRVSYDLTGLPPLPSELNAFLQDESYDAYEKVVDRLLSSKRYGEKFGRHWLDVVRYADSNGLDENLAYANAFRFRDYVIDVFNEDLPYDQFVRQQLAGDLLNTQNSAASDDSIRNLVATGFLSIGPKMLACDDGQKMEMDIIDEQLDTTFRTFLGLTMGCARCHDHKFDPLLTRDYYAAASIFKSTHTMENFKVVAQWHEHQLKTKERTDEIVRHQAESKKLNQLLQDAIASTKISLTKQHQSRAVEYLDEVTRQLTAKPMESANGRDSVGKDILSLPAEAIEKNPAVVLIEAENYTTGTFLIDKDRYGKGIGVTLNPGYAEYQFEIKTPGRYQLELRYAGRDSRPVKISLDGKSVKNDGAKEVTGGWDPKDQKWFVESILDLSIGTHRLRLERSSATPHIDKLLIVTINEELAKQLSERDDPIQLIPSVIADWKSFLAVQQKLPYSIWRNWMELPALRDGLRSGFQKVIDQVVSGDQQASGSDFARQIFGRKNLFRSIDKLDQKQLLKFASPEEKSKIETASKQINDHKSKTPIYDVAMGVREGKAVNLKVHIRGNYLTLGSQVKRQIPSVFSSKTEMPEKASGRLEFANWIANPENPLTARVISNRVWQWHFGRGIVATPDNFGRLGAPPKNQQLLDWLSSELVKSNWSLKKLHRKIVLSATYRMSTKFDEVAAATDPENRLHWRFNRRRLTAEEVRDTILYLSDDLDETIGGQLMPDKNRGYVTGTGSKQGSYDFLRRSVYLPVLRSAVYPVLQAFDFPDPAVQSGTRQSSTIAPQALFMMNGRLVLKHTEELAKSLAEHPDEAFDSQFSRIFVKSYSREPNASELLAFRKYYQQMLDGSNDVAEPTLKDRQQAWQSICRVLIASSEFIYID